MVMQAAKNVLNAFWDGNLPVKIENIASDLGVKIDCLKSSNPEHIGLSGLAEITDKERIIYFNRNESINRQRFTLAHEIGHHVLNHVTSENPKRRDDVGTFSSNTNQLEEQEANNFSAQLLMPEDGVKFLLFRKGITNIPQLASQFQVSEAAMYYRLKNMGLLSY
jgi:Zn-dependent peptidase ImmA (M78 family)